MKIQDFLAHHRIKQNPFSEEDAQTDEVFKDFCISSTYHPAWDKVYGNPADPSSSIVFGEKGSGKTAMRLQVQQHIEKYNVDNPEKRCFVVSYDDFNPFLDHFRERIGRRYKRPEKILSQYQLWDHMDSIMSLAVTKLVDHIIAPRSARPASKGDKDQATPNGHAIPKHPHRRLDRHQRRDLLLLASCYDNANSAPLGTRWRLLRRRIGGRSFLSWWPWALGMAGSLGVCAASIAAVVMDRMKDADGNPVYSVNLWDTCVRRFWWVYLLIAIACWGPWVYRFLNRWWTSVGIARRIRVLKRNALPLTRILMRFRGSALARQPLPNKDRTDDRYAMLAKLQGVLRSLGFSGMTVLVDRIDEPHLINGSAEAMRAFIWPMLDNKFLKQEGIGFKLLLPSELTEFIDREDRDFYQRARLDKQNMVPSLDWTGEALYDVACARLAACSDSATPPTLTDMIADSVPKQRLYDSLMSLRVPRHMFKFLYRSIVAHCNKYSDSEPEYRIASETYEAELAIYRQAQTTADKGMGA